MGEVERATKIFKDLYSLPLKLRAAITLTSLDTVMKDLDLTYDDLEQLKAEVDEVVGEI